MHQDPSVLGQAAPVLLKKKEIGKSAETFIICHVSSGHEFLCLYLMMRCSEAVKAPYIGLLVISNLKDTLTVEQKTLIDHQTVL